MRRRGSYCHHHHGHHCGHHHQIWPTTTCVARPSSRASSSSSSASTTSGYSSSSEFNNNKRRRRGDNLRNRKRSDAGRDQVIKDREETKGWCIYSAVALVAVGAYLNALGGDFVHDDIPAVVRNRDVLAEGSVLGVLKNDFWGTPMQDLSSHKSYRPLTTLTFR